MLTITFPLSYYLLTIPYTFIWKVLTIFRKQKQIHFYCDAYLDYVIFENVRPYLSEIKIVAKNKKVQKELVNYGIESILWPTFPDVIIMTRHAFHKFPSKRIKKLALNHGAYHFKNFIKAKRYNAFDMFLFTSEHEVQKAKDFGITCAHSGGYPKLDSFWFADTDEKVKDLKNRLKFNNDKANILFTATWDSSEMSAVDKWHNKLAELTDEYNVMVSLHPFTSQDYVLSIKKTKDVFYIEDSKNYLYLKLADLMITDTSSIIAEFCALDKPIITFSVKESERLTPHITKLIKEVSFQIDDFSVLKKTIKHALKNPQEKSPQRQKYNKIMFDELDGMHGKKAASKFIEALKTN